MLFKSTRANRPSYLRFPRSIFRHLGCPHGCAGGTRGPPGDLLRCTAQAILARLQRHHQKPFTAFYRVRQWGITGWKGGDSLMLCSFNELFVMVGLPFH